MTWRSSCWHTVLHPSARGVALRTAPDLVAHRLLPLWFMPLPQWPDRIYTFGSSDKARAAAFQTGARERRRACLAYEVTPQSTKKVEPFVLRTTPLLQPVNPVTPALARQPKHDLPSPVMFRRRGDPGCQEKRARVSRMPRRRFGGDLPVAARERGLSGVRRRAPFLSLRAPLSTLRVRPGR